MSIVTKRSLAGFGAAALSIAAFAAPAQATPGIGLHGPFTERYGFFPEYYQDQAGVRLQLCLDPSPLCGAVVVPNPGPISFPGNFPDELFYWSGTADVGGVMLTLAQEATYAGADGSQAVFGRVRIDDRNGALNPGWYRFTTPHGQFEGQAGKRPFVADAGCGPNGCINEAEFGLAGAGFVGPNFLTWPDYVNDPALPVGYVGDAATPHVVTGSTYNPDDATINPAAAPGAVPPPDAAAANYFRIDRITGPGGDVVEHIGQTSLFVIQGKLADDPPQPHLLATPGSAGSQPIAGGPKSFIVTVRNGGSGDLKLATATVGANPDFTVLGSQCDARTVQPAGRTQAPTAPDTTCKVEIAFDPSTAGAKTATLQIAQTAGPVHDIALTGVGTEPILGSDQGGLGFGVQPVGTTAPTLTATLRNTGNAPLLVDTASISGAEAADFAIVGNGCAGTTLAAGEGCSIDVQFTPTASSVRNASLDVASAAGSRSLSLSGTGSAPAPGQQVVIIQQTVAGTGDSGASAAAGMTAGSGGSVASVPKLTLKRLGTAKKIKRATARRSGLRLHMELLAGTEVVKINVYRRGGGTLKLVSSTTKSPGRIGDYRVSLTQAALRKALRRGIYEVHVTPGRSRTDLGTTAKFAFTVT
jgi:hypothetical protein